MLLSLWSHLRCLKETKTNRFPRFCLCTRPPLLHSAKTRLGVFIDTELSSARQQIEALRTVRRLSSLVPSRAARNRGSPPGPGRCTSPGTVWAGRWRRSWHGTWCDCPGRASGARRWLCTTSGRRESATAHLRNSTMRAWRRAGGCATTGTSSPR